jgi:predicted enzyme related to lactoylglutathione lyase
MVKTVAAFSGFSVDDLEKAKQFYAEVLGLAVEADTMGLHVQLPENGEVFVYQKDDHKPAEFTILNLVVEDIDEAVAQLASGGVVFEKYDFGDEMKQDEKGIMRGKAAEKGPDIAWFKDPAGNVLSVLQN